MRIAILGMGRMGQAVAGRLLAGGHELVVWNRTPGKAAALVARGAREAESIRAAVSGADLAMTSLANDDAVRAVACGGSGGGGGGDMRSSIGDGVYVDVSTISPALCAELDREFPRFAAMPILGAPGMVEEGRATYLLGASDGVAAAVEPILGCLSSAVRRYPAPPLASTAKLAVNLLLLDSIVALAESFAVGRAGGLTDDQLRELLGDSPMLAPGLKNRFEGVLTGKQDPWWTTVLGAKDARLAAELVSEAGGELPVTSAVRGQYDKAAAAGFADADIVAVAELYRRGRS